MADPFIGEIKIWANNFCPRGWAYCDGQIIAINQQSTLFAVIGTIYGGDGRVNFALPNLKCQVPMGIGQGPGLTYRSIGSFDGDSTVNLGLSEIPSHNHTVYANKEVAKEKIPDNQALYAAGYDKDGTGYTVFDYKIPDSTTILVSMSPAAVGFAGSSAPHENMQPFLGINFCIALEGIFPSRN